jgi:hypothetical protein
VLIATLPVLSPSPTIVWHASRHTSGFCSKDALLDRWAEVLMQAVSPSYEAYMSAGESRQSQVHEHGDS